MTFLAAAALAWPQTGYGAEALPIVPPAMAPPAAVIAPPPAVLNVQSLQEVLRRTYMSNPALEAARASVDAIEERLPQAQANWKPQIRAGGDITIQNTDRGTDDDSDGTTSKTVEASIVQPVYRGGRTVAAVGSAENLILARHALLRSAEQNTLLDAARSYLDVLRDTNLVSLTEKNRTLLAAQLEATRNRLEVGEVTKTDVSLSSARLARAEGDIIRARGDLQSSRARFERVTGQRPGNLIEPNVAFALPPTLDEALALAEANNPEIEAADYLHRSAEKDVGVIAGARLPELGLFGNWDKNIDPQPGGLDDNSTGSFGLTASVPLYSGGLATSRMREAQHTANQRYLEILDSRRRIRQDVITTWENLAAARAEIESRKAEVEAADLARQGVREEAEVGTRTILETLDAEQEFLDAEVALVNARREEIVATFELAAALGLMVPETLGFPDINEGQAAVAVQPETKKPGIEEAAPLAQP